MSSIGSPRNNNSSTKSSAIPFAVIIIAVFVVNVTFVNAKALSLRSDAVSTVKELHVCPSNGNSSTGVVIRALFKIDVHYKYIYVYFIRQKGNFIAEVATLAPQSVLLNFPIW